jgi:hypothetical protein
MAAVGCIGENVSVCKHRPPTQSSCSSRSTNTHTKSNHLKYRSRSISMCHTLCSASQSRSAKRFRHRSHCNGFRAQTRRRCRANADFNENVLLQLFESQNAQLRRELEEIVSLCMILCIVGIEIVLRLLLLSTSLTNSLKLSVVVVDCCCCRNNLHRHHRSSIEVDVVSFFRDDEDRLNTETIFGVDRKKLECVCRG